MSVSLAGVKTQIDLLTAMDRAFQFGGPLRDGQGWGYNWDALTDCLRCLDSGGIWGNSRKIFAFPLMITFLGIQELRAAEPQTAQILAEIMKDVQRYYAEQGKSLIVNLDGPTWRVLSDVEQLELGRVSYQLALDHGRNAYRHAAQLAKQAAAEGQTDKAYFWESVSASLRSREG